jgi:hypothetical protein
LYECRCQVQAWKSFSSLAELLTERTAPELAYVEAKWASLIPFCATGELLAEVLPVGQTLGTTSIRRKLHAVAERMESQLGEERFVFLSAESGASLPDPTAPLTMGLDGGYVHSCEPGPRQEGWFEVIVGKSVPADGAAKRFAFVNTYDTKPKRRLFEVGPPAASVRKFTLAYYTQDRPSDAAIKSNKSIPKRCASRLS